MKIALLISGEFREFAIAHKFWPFLHWDNVDIYFSVWSNSKIEFTRDGFDIEPVDVALMQSLNPKSIITDPPIEAPLHRNMKMIYRVKMGLDAIFNSNIDYDLIVNVRPDFFTFAPGEYFIKEFERALEKKVCIIDGYGPTGSGDSMIIFPIVHATRFRHYNFGVHFEPGKGDIHKVFRDYFFGFTEAMSDDFCHKHGIVRPNARMLSHEDQTSFRKVHELSGVWWEERYKEKFNYSGFNYNDPDCT